jgi:hypothetical protein
MGVIPKTHHALNLDIYAFIIIKKSLKIPMA